jgi:hypothetical protein
MSSEAEDFSGIAYVDHDHPPMPRNYVGEPFVEQSQSAQVAVERVRQIHQRGMWTATGRFYCKHCRNREVEWPCPTIRAIDGPSLPTEEPKPAQEKP